MIHPRRHNHIYHLHSHQLLLKTNTRSTLRRSQVTVILSIGEEIGAVLFLLSAAVGVLPGVVVVVMSIYYLSVRVAIIYIHIPGINLPCSLSAWLADVEGCDCSFVVESWWFWWWPWWKASSTLWMKLDILSGYLDRC